MAKCELPPEEEKILVNWVKEIVRPTFGDLLQEWYAFLKGKGIENPGPFIVTQFLVYVIEAQKWNYPEVTKDVVMSDVGSIYDDIENSSLKSSQTSKYGRMQ
jgi:hypothetical protein